MDHLHSWSSCHSWFLEANGKCDASVAAASSSRNRWNCSTCDYTAAFKRWDKNNDGFLSLEEYTNGLSKKGNAPQRFKNFDKTSDGKVSEEEFVKR